MFREVWLFQKFVWPKLYPTPVKLFFENRMGNPFSEFLNNELNSFKQNLEENYGHFHFKSAFRIFGKQI